MLGIIPANAWRMVLLARKPANDLYSVSVDCLSNHNQLPSIAAHSSMGSLEGKHIFMLLFLRCCAAYRIPYCMLVA